jgi:hypothetical protein
MSARRTFIHLAAVAGAVLVTFAFAPLAHAAEDVDVRISGLDSSMIAGGRGDSFTTVLRNRSGKTGYQHVQRVFHIRLGGLTPDGLRFARGGFNLLAVESAGPGAVRVVDPFPVQLTPEGDRGSIATGQYQIQFTSAAPQGTATVIFEAVSAGQSLGSASDSVRVRGLANQPEKTKPVPTVAVPPLTPGAQPSLAPLDDEVAGAAGGSGMPVIFYVLGALMVAAGGGILWLLFRERQPTLVGAQHSDPTYPSGGHGPPTSPYPTPSLYPTAVLPAIRDARAPGHEGSHRLDATHELGANPGRPRP